MSRISLFFALSFLNYCAQADIPLYGRDPRCNFSAFVVINGAYANYAGNNPSFLGKSFFPNKLFNHKPNPFFINCLYFYYAPTVSTFSVQYNIYKPFLMFSKNIGSCFIQASYNREQYTYSDFQFKSSDPNHITCLWDAKTQTISINVKNK